MGLGPLRRDWKSITNTSSLSRYVHSGCSSPVTDELSAFLKLEHIAPFNVEIGDKFAIIVKGKGDVELLVNVSKSVRRRVLRELLYVPSFQDSLISVSTLFCNGIHTSFHRCGVDISKNGTTGARGKAFAILYILNIISPGKPG